MGTWTAGTVRLSEGRKSNRQVGSLFVRYDTERERQESERCLVLGDWIVRNVGTEQNMAVDIFLWIRTEQLHRAMANMDLEAQIQLYFT